jgi:putative membrane protein
MLHAIINGTVAVLLVFSLRAIRRKNVKLHKKINLTAFVLSALFLISYVTYHYLVEHTVHPGSGAELMIYKIILYSHIVLSAIVLPLILLSFWYGLTNKVQKHKKLVRFSYPIWLYVAVTGVIVYLMISPYYPY